MLKKRNIKEIKGMAPLNRVFGSDRELQLFHKKWVKQLAVCFILLVIISISFLLRLPGSGVLRDYLAYYLHEEQSDWTPAIKTMVSSGLWLDSFDRKVFEEEYGNEEDEKVIQEEEPVVLPVSGKFVKEFGWINSPVDKNQIFHSGIDIETDYGAPVRAALDGTVKRVWNDEELGRAVEIEHKDGLSTIYGQCSEILVNNGQEVEAGQIIAKAGEGFGRGQLHFEVRRNGQPVDPLTVLSPSRSNI